MANRGPHGRTAAPAPSDRLHARRSTGRHPRCGEPRGTRALRTAERSASRTRSRTRVRWRVRPAQFTATAAVATAAVRSATRSTRITASPRSCGSCPDPMPRSWDRELLTPEEVLARYQGGPRTGVFTDGSCEGNPGPGGWGVGTRGGRPHPRTGQRHRSRHHQQPHGAARADRGVPLAASRAQVTSTRTAAWRRHDQLVGGGLGAPRLAAQGRADRQPELVQEVYAQTRPIPRVTQPWIQAHGGSRWNEYVDALANAYML